MWRLWVASSSSTEVGSGAVKVGPSKWEVEGLIAPVLVNDAVRSAEDDGDTHNEGAPADALYAETAGCTFGRSARTQRTLRGGDADAMWIEGWMQFEDDSTDQSLERHLNDQVKSSRVE